jgi:hypothetical protein
VSRATSQRFLHLPTQIFQRLRRLQQSRHSATTTDQVSRISGGLAIDADNSDICDGSDNTTHGSSEGTTVSTETSAVAIREAYVVVLIDAHSHHVSCLLLVYARVLTFRCSDQSSQAPRMSEVALQSYSRKLFTIS